MNRTVWGITIPSFRQFWELLKTTGSEFIEDNGIKLSAALSYYTIFSIPPLLIIIISVAGIVWGEQAIEGQIYAQIEGLVGKSSAMQVQEAMRATVLDTNSWWATTISVIALVFGATGVFVEIQDSINIIWGLKAKPKKGLIKMVIARLISFSMIISIGFLLTVSLTLNALLDIFNMHLQRLFPDVAFYAFYVINILLLITIITFLFATIFKLLPDAKITWKTVLFGAFFTSILFMIGKVLISLYLGKSDVGSAYGAAGSVVIILIWVYYSSMILFFGAEFTQVYVDKFGKGIEPNDYAVLVVRKEKEIPNENLKTEEKNYESKKH
ncbi:MAG: YihY/virulence factor BrkB family protein [Bacteroidota bacterium]|nr:YihY/virulence factor BrkB family protein [Bacteroidota bacterium]